MTHHYTEIWAWRRGRRLGGYGKVKPVTLMVYQQGTVKMIDPKKIVYFEYV
jgi:hypothetical protein